MKMKQRRWCTACLLALAALGVSVAASAATLQQIKDSGSIRIATANEIPYGYMQGDTAVGLGPSVAKKVLAKMGFARDVADRVCFFCDGRILEQGPLGEIFTRPREKRTRQFLRMVLQDDSAAPAQV